MKKMSLLLVVAMVLQSAPMVFAGGTPINNQTGIGGQNNQGIGGQNNQNAGWELDVIGNQNQNVSYGLGGQNDQSGKGGGANLFGLTPGKSETTVDLRPYQQVKKDTPVVTTDKGGNANQTVITNQSGQNNQGLQMIPLQVYNPSGGMYAGHAYVLNGIGDVQKYIQQCQQNGVAIKPGKGSDQQQYAQNGCNTREMSDREFQLAMAQLKHQQEMEKMQWAQQQVENQRLEQEAIRRQQAREQQTMMMFQMFGMVVPMALMTYQQHKDARETQKAYEQYRRDNQQYYQQRRSYRYNFPQQQYQGQQYQYGQFMAK